MKTDWHQLGFQGNCRHCQEGGWVRSPRTCWSLHRDKAPHSPFPALLRMAPVPPLIATYWPLPPLVRGAGAGGRFFAALPLLRSVPSSSAAGESSQLPQRNLSSRRLQAGLNATFPRSGERQHTRRQRRVCMSTASWETPLRLEPPREPRPHPAAARRTLPAGQARGEASPNPPAVTERQRQERRGDGTCHQHGPGPGLGRLTLPRRHDRHVSARGKKCPVHAAVTGLHGPRGSAISAGKRAPRTARQKSPARRDRPRINARLGRGCRRA